MSQPYLDALRALAEKATPGPWRHEPMSEDATIHKIRVSYTDAGYRHDLICLTDTGHSQHSSWAQRANDAEFIAACDPDTVRALVELVERQHAALRYVRIFTSEWQTSAREEIETTLAAYDAFGSATDREAEK